MRTKKERISKKKFEKNVRLGMPQEAIAMFFGISRQTLMSWVTETYGMTFSQFKKGVSNG